MLVCEADVRCISALHATRLPSCMPTVLSLPAPTSPSTLTPSSQIRQEDPLNLSISVSGGKETNKDSPSNGE